MYSAIYNTWIDSTIYTKRAISIKVKIQVNLLIIEIKRIIYLLYEYAWRECEQMFYPGKKQHSM